jgi:hypothetical protein
MSLQSERDRVNRTLTKNHLPSLDDDPGPLLHLLAKNCQTDKQFRSLLNKVEPQMRHVAYETMRPLLNFVPKPLEVYLAEMGEIAEREQLPIVDPSAPGGMRPFVPASIGDKQTVFDPGHLTLTCAKCTVQQEFQGETFVAAVIAAREAGWVHDKERGTEICPKCPAVRE